MKFTGAASKPGDGPELAVMVALVSVLPQLGPSTRTRPVRDSRGRTVPGERGETRSR